MGLKLSKSGIQPKIPEQKDFTFVRFLQLPLEIRDMVWSEAWATGKCKPEICTHLYTKSPTKGLPGFPPIQLIVDIDLALMHTCRESRAFLLSKAGGVRFRYSYAAKRNVPCRAFNPALDILYLGAHNFEDAMWGNQYFHGRRWQPYNRPRPGLHESEFTSCWKEVQNIALQPRILFPSTNIHNTRAGISATFPRLRRISIVVNPLVDLEFSVSGQAAVCPPTRRCRLVEADGDTTWPEMQPQLHWLDHIRQQIESLRAPNLSTTLSVQVFEVYVGRQGLKQWKKYPVSMTLRDEGETWRGVIE